MKKKKRLKKKEFALGLRRNPTAAEHALLVAIAGMPIEKRFTIYAQKIIGGYIVDVYIPAGKLVVEVDGGYHKRRTVYDSRRTAALIKYGYRVLRLTNERVFSDPEGCLRAIEWRIAHPELDVDVEHY
jgi:very-short-patch-repair endonuclease